MLVEKWSTEGEAGSDLIEVLTQRIKKLLSCQDSQVSSIFLNNAYGCEGLLKIKCKGVFYTLYDRGRDFKTTVAKIEKQFEKVFHAEHQKRLRLTEPCGG